VGVSPRGSVPPVGVSPSTCVAHRTIPPKTGITTRITVTGGDRWPCPRAQLYACQPPLQARKWRFGVFSAIGDSGCGKGVRSQLPERPCGDAIKRGIAGPRVRQRRMMRISLEGHFKRAISPAKVVSVRPCWKAEGLRNPIPL